MSRPDGGLRAEFRAHLPLWQWSSVESGLSSPGIPDSEFCTPVGVTGWIEFKVTNAWAVSFRPLQPGWIDRRSRLGGRVFIVVRRNNKTKKEGIVEELWIIPGRHVLRLAEHGLLFLSTETDVWRRRKWTWEEVGEKLTG